MFLAVYLPLRVGLYSVCVCACKRTFNALGNLMSAIRWTVSRVTKDALLPTNLLSDYIKV